MSNGAITKEIVQQFFKKNINLPYDLIPDLGTCSKEFKAGS